MGFVTIESPPTTSQFIPLNTKFCSIPPLFWPQFQCQVMTPPIRPPILGIRVDLGDRTWHQSKYRPRSYSTSVHSIGLSCTVWPQYTTRQTDSIGIGRLCYRRPNKFRNRPTASWGRHFQYMRNIQNIWFCSTSYC